MAADVEDPGLSGELTGVTNVFLQTVKAIGYPHTDLYTMASWLTARRFERVALIPKNLWLASYGVNQPGVDNVGTWQFTNNFQGLGVDMSYDFFGHYTTRLTGTLNGGVARVPTIRFHTVQPGESWGAIAHQYGHDMDKAGCIEWQDDFECDSPWGSAAGGIRFEVKTRVVFRLLAEGQLFLWYECPIKTSVNISKV
jgi:lysozyme